MPQPSTLAPYYVNSPLSPSNWPCPAPEPPWLASLRPNRTPPTVTAHPYVFLIHCAKSIHESHARARTPTPSLAVEMADRAKAKSITQAAWGFVNDSLMSPLCLVARPKLIAAAAFLLAVSHCLSKSPASDWEQQADPKLEHVIREYLSVDEDGNEQAGPISDSSNVTSNISSIHIPHPLLSPSKTNCREPV
ncbi:hypothetical protein PtA15_8A462 [Puccinia triticina]|uniref:Cyclin N-terminal domain-containing protein n=1 Tax=Puccinia triticina TaxID=208348 RepID=A0ABY7CRJ6_9BASI|nr:uncharacterized protein PtA15_8A462 [Puccinia triticina]WAQ87558.1 hypothetical protein PtA15_8A462 [Puccinia triticina]